MSFSCLHATKKRILHTIAIICSGTVFFLATTSVSAEEMGLSITIAPPLFQLSLQPGETWSSGITVVNSNPYDLSLYAEPILFEPSGESGRPVFITSPTGNSEEEDGMYSTLKDWITVPQKAVQITREQTYVLPISIHVPEDAAPGGHYAAVLIGNRAPEGTPEEGGTVNVTSSIASLIFLTVSGDVVEKGRIRDFVTEKSIYETPEANLSLRFENQGNVHLLPQGDITIYNMFGKVRGTIPVNVKKNYGNVLPESIRKFDFTWKSDAGMWDIGRYKAEATIGYGKEQKQSALATTYFYVLPIMPLLQVIGSLLVFVLFVGWVLRVYIRRALAIETALLHQKESTPKEHTSGAEVQKTVPEVPRIKLATLIQPIKTGFIDLRDIGVPKNEIHTIAQRKSASYAVHSEIEPLTLKTFIRKYWLFFVSIAVIGLGGFTVSLFFTDVMTVSRDYSISEVRPDGSAIEIPTE